MKQFKQSSAIRLLLYYVLVFSALLNPDILMARGTVVPFGDYQKASQFILEGQYDEAEIVFDRFMKEFPDEPAGPLLKAAVLHYRSIDYEDFSRDDEYNRLLDNAARLAVAKMKMDNEDLWARYFYYSARSLRAVWSVTNGNFITGIAKGVSGARGMSEIVSKDKEFYDAYLMVGSYRFWKSIAVERINWLPFVHDEREKGLSEVAIAISRGKLNGALSNTVLIEMLIVQNLTDAVTLCEEMVNRYPSCRLFAWQLGEAYKRTGRYDDAVCVLTGVAESMKRDPADDGSGPLRCWWKLAVLAKAMGKKEECKCYCEKIISIARKESVYNRQKKRFKGAREMLEELSNE